MIAQHDFIIFEPNTGTGVLKVNEGDVNSGIVKDFGPGYYTDTGSFVKQIPLDVGFKIIYTNHIQIEDDGKKYYITRGRDVILVQDGLKV